MFLNGDIHWKNNIGQEGDREHVIHMCFALSLEPDEAEEYLTKGLAEPSFQINDYYEILFLYGLYHHLSYEDCLKMADVFEENRRENIVFSGTKSTKELLAFFEIQKIAILKMQIVLRVVIRVVI